MAVDPRQVVAAILTMTMFATLANMIKKDHFDSIELPGTSNVELITVQQQGAGVVSKVAKGPWKEDGGELKPCWNTPSSKEIQQGKGFITFSLSNGPEYHVSQVADAVVIARYLGATLVLPDIRGSKPGEIRKFHEIYDAEKFIKNLDGVVKIAKEQPADITAKKAALVKVPSRVAEDYIAGQIEPIFRVNKKLRLVTFFPSVNMKKKKKVSKDMDSAFCLGMFGTLVLQPEIHEVIDIMIERMRTLSRRADGHFISVDLRTEILQQRGCKESGDNLLNGHKSCYNAQEIGVFLRKIGFDKDTTIYLTQSRWDDSLNSLKDIFPKTYTKEGIFPADKKVKFLDSGNSELEKALDFYICSRSDVFVPAISGLFYANVAGKRIANGQTQILVPARISDASASAADFISPYVSEKSHLAYSCFC